MYAETFIYTALFVYSGTISQFQVLVLFFLQNHTNLLKNECRRLNLKSVLLTES
jgi:hypothetical protein